MKAYLFLAIFLIGCGSPQGDVTLMYKGEIFQPETMLFVEKATAWDAKHLSTDFDMLYAVFEFESKDHLAALVDSVKVYFPYYDFHVKYYDI